MLATAYWATSAQGWCYPTGRCAYLPSVIRCRQSIKPPPPPPPLRAQNQAIRLGSNPTRLFASRLRTLFISCTQRDTQTHVTLSDWRLTERRYREGDG